MVQLTKTIQYILILLLLATVVDCKGNAIRRDRAWKAKRAQCEEQDCGHLIIEEAYNCVNKCTSQLCYDEVYAANPLEDGEIDFDRDREFISCLRREQLNIQV